MKHLVFALLLLISFSLCADTEKYIIADKSQRIGRFSYEDSFDEKLVEKVLKNSSAVVKKNVKKLLYPDNEDDVMGQRLLLLGGISNASTTAIAKAIALRCGYEYYVVEAAALLREYREGRQMLLSEVRPIIKQGKPIAIIITELPEMADYSGLLASTLWLLIDQCAQYPDVLVIATSGFQKGQLSEDVKEHFGADIVSVALDKCMKKKIENVRIQKTSWLERNKVACIVIAGFVCSALMAGYAFNEIVSLVMQVRKQQEDETKLLEQKIADFGNSMRLMVEENQQNKLFQSQLAEENNQQNKLLQNQQWDIQKELIKVKDGLDGGRWCCNRNRKK